MHLDDLHCYKVPDVDAYGTAFYLCCDCFTIEKMNGLNKIIVTIAFFAVGPLAHAAWLHGLLIGLNALPQLFESLPLN